MLPADDRAWIVWDFVLSLDLEPLYEKIEVTDNTAGRNAICPEILMALWLMATLDGIGKARELDRCCKRDLRYWWILGEVTMNYHTLSDFRVQHGELLNQTLVTQWRPWCIKGWCRWRRLRKTGCGVEFGCGVVSQKAHAGGTAERGASACGSFERRTAERNGRTQEVSQGTGRPRSQGADR